MGPREFALHPLQQEGGPRGLLRPHRARGAPDLPTLLGAAAPGSAARAPRAARRRLRARLPGFALLLTRRPGFSFSPPSAPKTGYASGNVELEQAFARRPRHPRPDPD